MLRCFVEQAKVVVQETWLNQFQSILLVICRTSGSKLATSETAQIYVVKQVFIADYIALHYFSTITYDQLSLHDEL